MRTIRINDEDFTVKDRLAACIGFFDGMHRGHQALIDETLRTAKERNLSPAMICFVPDPLEVISGKPAEHIYSYEKRKQIAESLGIRTYIVIGFDEKMMKMDPVGFVRDYLNRMNISCLVYGFDFRFGYKGRGDGETLKHYGGFECHMIDECCYYGSKISSTRIRENIRKGNFRLANRLLGRDYELNLKVINSVREGGKRLIYAKTADRNICIPEDGVYEGLFRIENGIFMIESDREMKTGERLDITIHE